MLAGWDHALKRAKAHAPFLERGLTRLPGLEALLVKGEGDEALAWTRTAGADAPDVPTALRRERLALAVALGIGDLAGAFPLARVMDELSRFADRALDAAIADAIHRRVPDADPAGFTVLALGKHGAGELNYSSDIDPILLYDPARLPRRERDDPGEAAQRIARTLVETLSAVTEEGYVFRVDLRLRPASEVSPLAISFDAALSHYESSALAWERAAFIRARPAAGDIAAGMAFLAAIRPFVWRRSLDFGAIEEIRRLTARIRSNTDGPRVPGPGYDLKRGRGGIREVEFFAQTNQLIHGGRKPSLRVRGTRAALDALAAEGIVSGEDAQVLGEAYDRLRTIEHRLQMVADHQTHAIPLDGAAIDNVARLDGLTGAAALLEELAGITASVAERYDRLLAEGGASVKPIPAVAGSALEHRLEALGFPEAGRLAERIAGWSEGGVRALRSEAGRAAFEAIFSALLDAMASAPEPHRTFTRWETLLVNLPSGVNLFRLLEARPGLLDQLMRILSLAPPLADELARRPELLDALIDATALDLPGSVADLVERMALPDGGDYQDLLDRVRQVVGELRFALGVQLIEGAQDPLEVGKALSRTAEAALVTCAAAVEEEFVRVHGRIAGGDLVVLGLGRLGGGMLTHASDLDIVYLFTGSFEAQSDGTRPLGAVHYFNRLSQRLTAALSVPTAQGALYEVDTRLRPEGNQGPPAVSLEAFARYQQRDAWTWEHMALTRARVLYGPEAGRRELATIFADVLGRPRDPAQLKEAVLAMRAEMAAHKAPAGELDAKLLRGGLVDLEFLIHFVQLREQAALVPNLGEALGMLVSEGFLPAQLEAAHTLLSRLLIAARLLAPDCAEPHEAAAQTLARACGVDDFAALVKALGEARRAVAAVWGDMFGVELEIVP